MSKVYLLFSFYLLFNFCTLTSLLGQKTNVSLEDVWQKHVFYQPSTSSYNWMKNDNFYSVLEPNKGIYKVSVLNESDSKIIVDASIVVDENGKQIKFDDYSFNSDETKVILTANQKPIYRRSSTLTAYVFDIASQKTVTIMEGKPIQLPTLSPDGNKLAFVYENNLYYTVLSTQKTIQVTNDGQKNAIINGTCDWVYEEEFGFVNAFHWSKQGDMLAYYRFDESKVKEFTMQIFGKLYPKNVTFKYPKAGEENSEIQIFVYNINTEKKTKIDIGTEKDIYIPRIKWTNQNNKLALMRMNRLQNKLEILIADATSGVSAPIVTETSDTYISEVTDESWLFLEDKDQFVWQSERDGFNHLYLYDINGKLLNQITKGEYDITSVYGIGQKESTVYYTSSEVSPLERYIYRINLDGKKKQKLTDSKGMNSGEFSSNFNYFIKNHSAVNIPPVVSLCNNEGKEIKKLVDNAHTVNIIDKYNISPLEFFTFKGDDGTPLNGWMIKPLNMESGKKYPVLMFVYGGPGSQEVENQYNSHNFYWYQYLASKGYMVACVDNRGTGARGVKFKKITYGQLGKYETEDQIAAARYLGKLPYVDANRIGIWGWSYGGYMSSLCLLKGNDIFKCAIAVAPVTNWRFYDTIYTERYMGLPQNNADGYDNNSPIFHVDKLKGKYLLIHGIADDNVHFQNATDMTTALVEANKQFNHFFYPNKNHGIGGKNTRYHLFKQVSEFIFQNL